MKAIVSTDQLFAEVCQVVGGGAAFQVVLALVLQERLEGEPFAVPVPLCPAEVLTLAGYLPGPA